MSYTIIDAENTMRLWAQTITGCPFYIRDESVGRPSGLYGTVKFYVTSKIGTHIFQDSPITIDGDPWTKHEINSRITGVFTFNAYRTGARQVISSMETNAYQNYAGEILQLANIGFVNLSTMQDLTQIVEAVYEERAQIDVTCNLIGYATEDLNTITNVTLKNISANITSEVSI